jgi:NADH dehydrogenase FAD-containing subunit
MPYLRLTSHYPPCALLRIRIFAQVAAQQGKYLAKLFNSNQEHFYALTGTGIGTGTGTGAEGSSSNRDHGAAAVRASSSSSIRAGEAALTLPDFKYAHLGSMASVGDWKGVVDTPNIGTSSSCVPQLLLSLLVYGGPCCYPPCHRWDIAVAVVLAVTFYSI